MAHGDAREGKWSGNCRMEWVASTLHTTSEHAVSRITTADAHTSAASSRLNWRSPADLNGLVRFAERRNLVSARVPSHFNWALRALMPLFTAPRNGKNVRVISGFCHGLKWDHSSLWDTKVALIGIYRRFGSTGPTASGNWLEINAA